KDPKIEGNQGLDVIVSSLASSGANLPGLELAINDVRLAMRDPSSSDRPKANASLDLLVQELNDKGVDLTRVQDQVTAVRQAIRG
ncbi:MAG: hypothetical protein WC250_04030, partial [Candidatus Paceibacterota bacterium]